MRILIHSNAPWVPSGYGRQTALLLRVLRELEHEAAVSAFYGLSGGPMEWDGHLVLPAGRQAYGVDMLPEHADAWRADLVITLMDFWQLAPITEQLQSMNVAAWLPVDCTPLGMPDRETLRRSGARPIAMAPFGQKVLEEAGWHDVLYAPHMHDVDQEAYEEAAAQRLAYRDGMGLTDAFVVGMCAANNDAIRKGFPEQFEAFRRFHKDHPEAQLLVHSITPSPNGHDLVQLAHSMDLAGKVRFTPAYPQLSGAFGADSLMRDWFSVLDVLTSCSYAEAFGVPMLEAQALGTPVVSTAGSAMRDVNKVGWHADGEPYWNPVHQAWWTRPHIGAIRRCYDKAFKDAHNRRGKARVFAADFHVSHGPEWWEPILKELEPRG